MLISISILRMKIIVKCIKKALSRNFTLKYYMVRIISIVLDGTVAAHYIVMFLLVSTGVKK